MALWGFLSQSFWFLFDFLAQLNAGISLLKCFLYSCLQPCDIVTPAAISLFVLKRRIQAYYNVPVDRRVLFRSATPLVAAQFL